MPHIVQDLIVDRELHYPPVVSMKQPTKPRRRDPTSPTPPGPSDPQAIDLLHEQLRWFIDRWSPVLGVEVKHWRMELLQDYWASTNWSRSAITFCTRLAGKPFNFVEFVVVHELVHLVRGPHGHDQRFYDLMDRYLPNWRRYKLRKKRARRGD